MDSSNAREQYEETVSERLNEAEEETTEEAERSGNCCRSSSPRRAPRQHQISESKSVRVEPSVICQVTDDVYAFRDDSSTERLCKVRVCFINSSFSDELSLHFRFYFRISKSSKQMTFQMLTAFHNAFQNATTFHNVNEMSSWSEFRHRT